MQFDDFSNIWIWVWGKFQSFSHKFQHDRVFFDLNMVPPSHKLTSANIEDSSRKLMNKLQLIFSST